MHQQMWFKNVDECAFGGLGFIIRLISVTQRPNKELIGSALLNTHIRYNDMIMRGLDGLLKKKKQQ